MGDCFLITKDIDGVPYWFSKAETGNDGWCSWSKYGPHNAFICYGEDELEKALKIAMNDLKRNYESLKRAKEQNGYTYELKPIVTLNIQKIVWSDTKEVRVD